MIQDTEKFRFTTNENDLEWIYLDNPSPMTLYLTRQWFEKVLGKENIESHCVWGSFTNTFKFKKSKLELVEQEIMPELVEEDDYFFRKQAMTEANQI